MIIVFYELVDDQIIESLYIFKYYQIKIQSN